MSKRLTTEEFIEKSQDVHGLTYDYSESEYINAITKLKIICRIHGPFMQKPNKHYSHGCPGCGLVNNGQNKTLKAAKDFIPDSIKIHGDTYDYSEVKYVHSQEKVKIICSIHGPFLQTPNNHLKGQGCINCGNDKRNKNKNEQAALDFIPNAIAEHGPKYDYSEVEYIDSQTKVKIICKKHGPFLQTPNNHLSGSGCLTCGKNKRARNWLKLYETNTALGSEPGIFYILKFKHISGLEFLKAGITNRSIKERYSGNKYKDFTYEILEEQFMTNLESAQKEQEFLKENKEYKFKFPDDIKFEGYTETFNFELLEHSIT